MGKNTGKHDFGGQKDRSGGGSAPGNFSTEKDRKTGTKVIKPDQIEQDLGEGCGSKEPFGK